AVLARDLSRLYDSALTGRPAQLPALRIGYTDYAAWHNRLLRSELIEPHRRYWHHKLAGDLPALSLPTDHPRPRVQTFDGNDLSFALDADRLGALLALGRGRNASLFMGLLAVLKALLFAHTGQEDIIVGTPIAGRDHPDLADQVGLYLNTLALRDQFRGEVPF